jgi:hypothetical protein
MAVIIWHLLTKGEDCAFGRPALLQAKIRQMEIKAGLPAKRGGNAPGQARNYNIKALREQERALVAQAEMAYARFVAAWRERPAQPHRRAGAARQERLAGRCHGRDRLATPAQMRRKKARNGPGVAAAAHAASTRRPRGIAPVRASISAHNRPVRRRTGAPAD